LKYILKTNRLQLRELITSDKDELKKILSDKEAMKYYPRPFTDQEVTNWINRNIDNYTRYGFGLWAVILKQTDTFLGDCGITMQDIDGEKLPELGYHIKKGFWNQGFATEAATACIEYAYNILKIDTIYTYTKENNYASIKVAKKAGMKFLKMFCKSVMGEKVNEVLYYKKLST